MRFFLVVFGVLLFTPFCFAQKRNTYNRVFQFSVTPGLSSNGMHPGGYANYFSLNLSAGYSAANYLLELGIVSNLNENETRGLQIAGLTNFTGANAFKGMQKKEQDQKIKSGFQANLSGIQISGLANVVLNNVFGWQTSGVNVVKGALQGLQLAGISNTVFKYSFGVQLAGVYNVSASSMDGLQIASLFNITSGGLYGAQIGCFNRAGFIEGKNSYDNNDPTAIQIGIINTAKKMNGFQVGLINKSKHMQGTQIGLINIYKGGTMAETRDGTSLGLLNFGSSGYFSLYANEIFFTNIEIATGTVKNRRVKSDKKEVQIQNVLLYSNDPSFLERNKRWAFGYGIRKMYFSRSSQPLTNKVRFLSLGIDWMHINYDKKKVTKSLSLLTRPNVSVGSRLHPKLRSIYIFTTLSYNVYSSNNVNKIASSFLEHAWTNRIAHVSMWPGISGGILIQ